MRTNLSTIAFVCFSITTLSLPAAVDAAAMIKIDTAKVDLGTFRRSQLDQAKHVFIIKNTGNEDLVLANVKPGCHCTVVGFDTIIPPGRTGKINAGIDLKGLPSGPQSKYLAVTSNAGNEPTLQLELHFKLLPLIGTKTTFISAISTNGEPAKATIVFTTEEKDLLFKKVSFQVDSTLQYLKPRCQVKHTVRRSEKVDADGYWEYAVELACAIDAPRGITGAFVFETNHPQLPKVDLRGIMQAIKPAAANPAGATSPKAN
jgi:hypothetical protein